MIIRYALIAALCTCLLLLGGILWLSAGKASAEAEVTTLTRSVAVLGAERTQRDEAAKVAAARAARWETRAGELNATIETILTATLGECADAPLDPDLADILDGLRKAD